MCARSGNSGDISEPLGESILVVIHPRKSSAHVIEIDSQVADGRLDVGVPEDLRNSLYRDSGTICGTSEGPPEGVVGEVESKAVRELMHHGAVEAVASVGIRSCRRLAIVVTPEDQFIRDPPSGIVGMHLDNHPVALLEPSCEDLLGQRMERNVPPLTVPLTFSADRDEALLRIIAHVDVYHPETDDLDYPETETEFKVDHEFLDRGLLACEELIAFLFGEPIHIGAVVLTEVDAHLVDHVVLEVLQITSEDVLVPILRGYCELLGVPIVDDELDRLLIILARVVAVTVLSDQGIDVVEDCSILVLGLLLVLPVRHIEVLLDACQT